MSEQQIEFINLLLKEGVSFVFLFIILSMCIYFGKLYLVVIENENVRRHTVTIQLIKVLSKMSTTGDNLEE